MAFRKIKSIPINKIDAMEGYQKEIFDDESMRLLISSIKEHGVIIPAVVRKKENSRYEMISGHRRMYACEKLGIKTIRCEVKSLTRDKSLKEHLNENIVAR